MKFGQGVLILAVVLVASATAYAQTPPPSPPVVGAPLDGLSILLILVGAGYGSYRASRTDKK